MAFLHQNTKDKKKQLSELPHQILFQNVYKLSPFSLQPYIIARG